VHAACSTSRRTTLGAATPESRAQAPAVSETVGPDSDDEERADIISPDAAAATSPIVNLESLGPAGRSGVRRAHVIQDFKISTRSSQAHLPSSPRDVSESVEERPGFFHSFAQQGSLFHRLGWSITYSTQFKTVLVRNKTA
jgi:hypothetical protein